MGCSAPKASSALTHATLRPVRCRPSRRESASPEELYGRSEGFEPDGEEPVDGGVEDGMFDRALAVALPASLVVLWFRWLRRLRPGRRRSRGCGLSPIAVGG